MKGDGFVGRRSYSVRVGDMLLKVSVWGLRKKMHFVL